MLFFSFYYLLPLLFRSSVSSLPQQQPPSRPAELRTRQRIYVNGSDNDSRPTSALSTSSGVSRTTTAAHHAVSFFLVHTNARIVTWSTKVEKWSWLYRHRSWWIVRTTDGETRSGLTPFPALSRKEECIYVQRWTVTLLCPHQVPMRTVCPIPNPFPRPSSMTCTTTTPLYVDPTGILK